MKKNNRKTKGKSLSKKDETRRSSNFDLSLDNSLDEIFRFDDKLIGKRTNAIFQPKPIEDGFYDVEYKSNMQSDLSNNTYESFDIRNIDEISDIDERKNQKMVRMLRQIEMQASQLTLNDLSKIQKLIEQDEAQYSDQKDVINAVTQPVNTISFDMTQKSFVSRQISTIQKKNHTPPEYQEEPPFVDNQKSTRSRPGSQKKKNQKKFYKSKPKDNKAQQNKKNKGSVNNQKKNQVNQITDFRQKQSTYQRLQRQQAFKGTVFQKTPQNQKNNARIKSKKNASMNQSKKNEKQLFTGAEIRKPGATFERKRVPLSMSQDIQQTVPKVKKFQIRMNLNIPYNEPDYSPFGMIRETRYPQRFRIPPLRGWQNQRRNYKNGQLSSITLIKDQYGRSIEQVIHIQKQKIIN